MVSRKIRLSVQNRAFNERSGLIVIRTCANGNSVSCKTVQGVLQFFSENIQRSKTRIRRKGEKSILQINRTLPAANDFAGAHLKTWEKSSGFLRGITRMSLL